MVTILNEFIPDWCVQLQSKWNCRCRCSRAREAANCLRSSLPEKSSTSTSSSASPDRPTIPLPLAGQRQTEPRLQGRTCSLWTPWKGYFPVKWRTNCSCMSNLLVTIIILWVSISANFVPIQRDPKGLVIWIFSGFTLKFRFNETLNLLSENLIHISSWDRGGL